MKVYAAAAAVPLVMDTRGCDVFLLPSLLGCLSSAHGLGVYRLITSGRERERERERERVTHSIINDGFC